MRHANSEPPDRYCPELRPAVLPRCDPAAGLHRFDLHSSPLDFITVPASHPTSLPRASGSGTAAFHHELQSFRSSNPGCFPEASPEAPVRYALLVTTKSLRQSRESGESSRKTEPKGPAPGTEACRYIRIISFPSRPFRLPHHVAQCAQHAPQQRSAPDKDQRHRKKQPTDRLRTQNFICFYCFYIHFFMPLCFVSKSCRFSVRSFPSDLPAPAA